MTSQIRLLLTENCLKHAWRTHDVCVQTDCFANIFDSTVSHAAVVREKEKKELFFFLLSLFSTLCVHL